MRKKFTRQILSLMIALICVFGMGITAYADAEYDSGMTKKEVIKKYSVDTGYEEADAMFNEYLEAASVLLTDEKYDELYQLWEEYILSENDYIEYAGGTAEEWDAMTTFEKVQCDYLYITPLKMLARGNYEHYFGTLQEYKLRVYESEYKELEACEPELAEAYAQIMDWQYYYITENGAVYNFMTGVDSNGNKPGVESNGDKPGAGSEMSPVLIIVVVVVVALAAFVVFGKKKGKGGKKTA